jgi:hypothetical protein
MPSPTPDERLAEQAESTEQIVRQCEIALKELDKPTAGKPGKETHIMNAIQRWDAMIEELRQRGMSHARAVREIAVKNSDLHKDYLREYNAQHGRVVG